MDIFRRKKFDEAMFAKNRTLAIRVGQYQSSDIKEASFDYGYIKGDAYKPGGTCAGSAKIVFTSIITTFNKLDKVYPEIGLLVDGTYEWVKMGEYFINDIEIDRNRNTTKLDLMDGMFKLNRPYESSLTYPAPIQKIVAEIANQTGVKLEDAYFDATDLTGQVYYIDKKPDGKKSTYRDVLSLATQILGRSCFFNRDGNLEIRELIDSGLVVTADSYFMHGLTKSEVQYQIAGISCKKDKETLTVGLRTGRSLEIENSLMTQSMLDNLYHKIKDIRYYPFNLNYQGHLLLDVGQWVTIKTNKGETFKSPVLSQSFTFKGGLRGRISADSKSGNDAQYSYAGTFTKKIEQFSEFEKQIQNQIEEADKGFDKKVEKIKNDFNDQVELAKAKAEEVKRQLSDVIDQRFRDFDSAGLREARQKADEALSKVGANTLLAQEAKQISEQLRRQLDTKADLVEFQRVKETNLLYERIIGRSESDIADKVARIALTNQLFQVEVGKYANAGGPNMLRNSRADDGLKYWTEANGRLSFTAHTYYFNGQKRMFELRPGAVVTSPRFIVKRNADYVFNILGFDNNSKYFRVYFCKRKKGSSANFEQKQLVFDGQPRWNDGPVFDNAKAVKKSFKFNVGDYDDGYLQFEYDRNNPSKWGGLFMTELDFYEGDNDRKWQPAPEDATMETDKTLEATQTKLTLLQGSFAFQNLTSAGSIISQINATNNQILIEAEKIRLKGKTLLDELTAIDGYFKRLFVGEGNFAKLNAEIIGSRTITADKLIMDQAMARLFVSSDIFTDTLAAKEAFINKLRSVVVSATLLEGYKGKIGGFQIGTHDKDPSAYWLTGQNQFEVGMSNGNASGFQTALWVNWGNDWNTPGIGAWFVKHSGEMYCYRPAHFWNRPVVHGDLEVTGSILYYKKEGNFSKVAGKWIYSPDYEKIESSNGYLYLYRNSNNYSWIPLNKEISDRRYKSNIEDSIVSGLGVIEKLKTYSYRKEYDGKIEDISCGIMAQDVQKYVPEAFYENPDGAYSYRTFELVPYLIKAIQELNQKIQKLEKTA
ncbi:tail fiber domain-containing protein [Streptococcus oralis]|uniref:tail fiber domain-containing protein n=1 Tax=Streptococcus oralis TaxID=1303 RepID=UPI002284E652|nr:tail fiber domain-containing protein [Streptococcus oralis]MCY7087222.1 tail fiber domain-containing protein [Streptococcus oralis]